MCGCTCEFAKAGECRLWLTLPKVLTPGRMPSSYYLSMPLCCLSFQTCKSRSDCSEANVQTFPTAVRKILKFLRTWSSVACSGRSTRSPSTLMGLWIHPFDFLCVFGFSRQDFSCWVPGGSGENSLQKQKLKNESLTAHAGRKPVWDLNRVPEGR